MAYKAVNVSHELLSANVPNAGNPAQNKSSARLQFSIGLAVELCFVAAVRFRTNRSCLRLSLDEAPFLEDYDATESLAVGHEPREPIDKYPGYPLDHPPRQQHLS